MEKKECLQMLLKDIELARHNKEESFVAGAIPVGISNRHIHISKEDLYDLFGKGYQLTAIKDLKQPGQFACEETVTLIGPNGEISNVRILGPVRSQTQIEILVADNYKLGIQAPIRESGDLKNTPSIKIKGPLGIKELKCGAIVAKRHIHMLPYQAALYGVEDKSVVSLKVDTQRGGVLSNVIVRVSDSSGLECHIDTEEANAMGIKPNSKLFIINEK